MGAMAVVVVDVGAERAIELTATEDQHPVEALTPLRHPLGLPIASSTKEPSYPFLGPLSQWEALVERRLSSILELLDGSGPRDDVLEASPYDVSGLERQAPESAAGLPTHENLVV